MGLQLQGLLPEMGEEAEICKPVWHPSKNGVAYARRISTDDRTDAGDGLCGEESTGISDAGGDQSEFWKYIWFS